jgi:SAM-dependent methyltransferase
VVAASRRRPTAIVVADVDVFDRPAGWRVHAVARLGLSGEDRTAGLATGAGYPQSLEPIREVVAALRGAVCDVGSGLGAAAAWVGAGGSARMLAVEPELRAAALARDAFPELRVVGAAADALPLADGSCAGATLLGVVSLLPDVTTVLAEVRRVVAPGGRVGLTDLVTASRPADIPATGNRLRPLDELEAALADHGIAVDAVTWTAVDEARWADVAAAVDAEIAVRHAGTPAYDAWRSDGDVVGRLLADGQLRIVTIVATRSTSVSLR